MQTLQTQDRLLVYGSSKTPGICWMRAFHTSLGIVAVFSELPTNPGLSVTNGAEDIVQACLPFGIHPDEAIFLEHYAPFSYNSPAEDHRFARIRLTDKGRVSWEHFPTQTVVQLLGEAFLQATPA